MKKEKEQKFAIFIHFSIYNFNFLNFVTIFALVLDILYKKKT